MACKCKRRGTVKQPVKTIKVPDNKEKIIELIYGM